MTDTPLRRSGVLTFPGSPTDERMAVAILVTQSDAGDYHSFIKTGQGFRPVPDALGAIVALEVELANPEGNSHGE
jgi:hypothetical protein